jgi:hypothetical protein
MGWHCRQPSPLLQQPCLCDSLFTGTLLLPDLLTQAEHKPVNWRKLA